MKNDPPKSTNDTLESERGMVAYKESTCDPIFLFQLRRINCSEADYSEMESNGWKFDEGWTDENGEDLNGNDFLAHDLCTLTWETQKVFAHREEARIYGGARPYAWGDEGEGWRVYCVSAEGDLRGLLLQAGAYSPDKSPSEASTYGINIQRPPRSNDKVQDS